MVGNEFLRSEDDPAEAAALAVDVLGCRIDDAVGAELERALIERGGEYVVDHEGGSRRMRDPGDCLDVENLQRRIRRAFQEERLGAWAHRALPLLEIAAVNEGRGNAVARQVLLHDI